MGSYLLYRQASRRTGRGLESSQLSRFRLLPRWSSSRVSSLLLLRSEYLRLETEEDELDPVTNDGLVDRFLEL